MKTLIATLILALPMAAQSPMFRGNPAHTGVYPAPAKALTGQIAWSYTTMDWDTYLKLGATGGGMDWPTTPAAVNGRLYFCDGPLFFALDPQGTLIYRVQLGGWTLGSPAVAGDTAYIAANDGNLYALDVRDGKERWRCRLSHPNLLNQYDNWDVFHSSPTVARGTIYVGSVDGQMHAVSSHGELLWRFRTGGAIRATPAVADGRVFFGSFDGKVYALSALTGHKLWDMDTRLPNIPWAQVQGSCAVQDGRVFVGGRNAHYFALDAATGAVCFSESHHGSWVTSSPAVRDGISYVGDSDNRKVEAVDASGKVIWTYQAAGGVFASPALAGDVLYVASNDGYNLNGTGSVAALNALTGEQLWTLQLPASVWTSPVPANGMLYVGCADGNLYAIR